MLSQWNFVPNCHLDIYLGTLVAPVNPPDFVSADCQHMKPYYQTQIAKNVLIHRLIYDSRAINAIFTSTDIAAGIQVLLYDDTGMTAWWLTVHDTSTFPYVLSPGVYQIDHTMLICTLADF